MRSRRFFLFLLLLAEETHGFICSKRSKSRPIHQVKICIQKQDKTRTDQTQDDPDAENEFVDTITDQTQGEPGVENKFVIDSPLSQLPPDERNSKVRVPFSRNEQWLEKATSDMLNEEVYPVGKLTEYDVDSAVGIMAAWARRRSFHAALTVEKILKRIVDDMRANNTDIHVNSRMYVVAIDAWAKSGETGSAHRAQAIHDAMINLYQATGDPKMRPSVVSYNAVMYAWSRSNDPQRITMAERLLAQMLGANHTKDNNTVLPDAITFSTLMDGYARSKAPNSTLRCEELFGMMDELGVKRNVYTFSALQNVYARSGLPDAPQKARAVLDQMLELYTKGDVFAKPNCVNYNAVLNALSRTPNRRSAEMANEILDKMELPVSEGGFDVSPDRLSYAVTILTCSRCPDKVFAAKMAESNLEKMEARACLEAQRKEEISSAAPAAVILDIESFNVVLTSISRCHRKDAPQRMLQIIRRMENYADAGLENIRPNIRSWNAVLNAFARSSDPQKAEGVLNHIYSLYRAGWQALKPDAFSFAAVLSAYQKSSEPTAAERADQIVKRMEELYEAGEIDVQPDVYHYTILCSIWARSRKVLAADRCVQVLAHMIERDVSPNVRTYNAVLDCLARTRDEDRAEQLLYHMLNAGRVDKDVKPDCFSFNSVIHAITKSKKKGSGRRAEAVLDRLLEYYEEENNPAARPDSRSFTQIIGYYSKSRAMDAPYRAEYLLNRMVSLFKSGYKNLAPNNWAITQVMDSYSFARHADAGANAERLLKLVNRLKQDYGVWSLTVDTSVMNSVLFAWASCDNEDAGRRAESHLDEMEQNFEDGVMEIEPDTRSYGLVMTAWSKSSSLDKANRALQILRRMQEQQQKGNPNVVVGEHAYSVVINTCAFSNANPDVEAEAFDIAVTMLDELISSDSCSPQSLTYGWFIQACGRLRVPDRIKNTQILRAFKLCGDDGLVNDFVFQRFKVAASETTFRLAMAPVLGNVSTTDEKRPRVSFSDLPTEWTRHCWKRRKPRNSW